MELRPYQRDILDAILTNYRAGIRRQVVVAATGTGKSAVLSRIPAMMHADLPGQTLVLVHTTELVQQNAEELRQANPDLKVSIEMANLHADPDADIVMASVQTLGRANTRRLTNFNWDNFNICVVDECQHSTCDAYTRIFETGGFLAKDSRKLLVGFTATPNRSDGTPLKEVYEKIVFSYPIRKGIEEQYLCDLIGIRIDTRTCLDNIRIVDRDFNQTELADAVDTDERNNLIVTGWLKEASPRKTIVFAVNIAHAQHLAEAFQKRGISAEAVWGTDEQRAAKLARHKSGEILVLTNVALLTEGYNDPSIKSVVLAAPTKSNLRFTQCCGRGTRIFPGKINCLIVDVVDSTRKHSLMGLPSLLGLPKDLNLHGQSAMAALKIVEDAAREYPHVDLSGLQDVNKIREFIERVNLWEVKFPEEVVAHSSLSWFRTMDGYVLSVSNGERATIKQNILGKFEVSIPLHGRTYSGERDSLEAAFQAADATIQQHGGDIVRVVSQKQRWHKDAATERQIATIRKLYKGRAIPSDLTKGAAAKLISQFFAQNDETGESATAGQLKYLNVLLRQRKISSIPPNISKRDAGRIIGNVKGATRKVA